MEISLGACPLGIYAFDRDGKLLANRQFSFGVGEVSKKLGLIKTGNALEEHSELVEELMGEDYSVFTLESEKIAVELRRKFSAADFKVETPNLAGRKLRESIHEIAEKAGIGDVSSYIREVNTLVTREQLRKEASERDKVIIQVIDTIDDLDKTINALYERIREWYGIHFPELEKHVTENRDYFEIIKIMGRRENLTKGGLTELGFSPETTKKILRDASGSTGADFDEVDIEILQFCVERTLNAFDIREEISDYLEGLMGQVSPNIKELVGSLLGARLISIAGGLDDLAMMPSSTIQVLGAERALFRSLRSDTKPPKHGVIFQYPEIRRSPKPVRGKIARALAGKLAIAAKVDSMSGRYVGDRLNRELEEKIKSIKKRERD